MSTFLQGLEYFYKQEHFTMNKNAIDEMRSDYMLLLRISQRNQGFLCESDFQESYCSASKMTELNPSYEGESP